MEQSEKINRITGETLLQQKQEEFLSLHEQAQAGNVMAQYNIGICYLYGQNTKCDYKKAYLWLEKAAEQGDKLAGLFMGNFNELGVGKNINYSQAVSYYKTYSPSITEVDKTALWEKAKKLDEKEIEKNLSEIYTKALKLGESILNIKGFCVYYPKDNSFNFKWDNSTRSEFKQPLEEYNKLVEEFRIYLDAYTSDSDDERYGYWMYIYEDTLNLVYEICNALVGRDTLYRYLDKVGFPTIEKNKNFEFALGRCLIDDNDKTDNDYIISGLLLIAGHDEDPIWQNKVGLWYEYRNENKDLLQAELWYKKAAKSDFSAAQVNIERLKGEKEYKLITDKSEGSSEDRLKVVKTIRGNEELRNKWLLSAAILGNETAAERLAATIDVKGDSVYNKVCNFEPSWKRIELEKTDCKKKIDTWKQTVENNRKRYIKEEEARKKATEEEARRKAAEEEARRKAAEEEARRKAAEEEARRKAAEEEERRRQEGLEEKSSLKKLIWILIALLIAVVAGWYFLIRETGNNEPEVKDSTEQVDRLSSDDEAAISKRVTEIYNDVFSYNGEDYDSKYCSKSFLALVKEFDEAYEKANTGDLIGPDCDHWTAAQDCDNPSMSIISISKLSDKEATAKIHVKAFKDSDGTDVKLKMIYENGNWFIDDFIIGDYSERDEYQGGIDTLKDLANANKRISEAYIQKLKEHAKGEYMRCEYFLFDITKDGIPELWIVSGTCEADNKLTTYTHDLNMICQTSAMHSGFCKGNDYILQVSGQMGYSTWIKLYYDGNKIQEKTIFKEGPVEEYTKPKEKGITLTDYKDITPIKNAFK